MPRRLAQLLVGLVLYGATMGLMVRSGLGLNPWDVFHEGTSGLTGLSFGTVTVVVGAVVLLAWIPLRQRPGVGTLANVVVIGVAVDLTLWLLPEPEHLAVRIAYLLTGIVGNGVAGGMYIGAGLGPGPRDGLMTGLVRVTGRSTRLVRTSIELTVLALGWVIGGTVGLGTVLYALAVGPVVQLALGWFTIHPRPGQVSPSSPASQVSASPNSAAPVQPGTRDGAPSARG